MAKSAKRKEVTPDWLVDELKALPDLDEGFDIDLPGFDFDLAGLDEVIGIGNDLPGLDLGFDLGSLGNGVLTPPKNVRARVMGNGSDKAAKSKPVCGAKARTGKPCKAPGIGRGGRCKRHGGMSTGPKTQDGKERSLAALRGARN